MNITISINEVLRDVLGKFQNVYEKYHNTELENDIITPNLLDYVDFKTQDELLISYMKRPRWKYLAKQKKQKLILYHI